MSGRACVAEFRSDAVSGKVVRIAADEGHTREIKSLRDEAFYVGGKADAGIH